MYENTDIKEKTVNISEVIKFLRFPLAVMVVLIHSNNTNVMLKGEVFDLKSGLCPIYESLTYIVSETISRCAVPCFFLISGFLFFWGVEKFTAATYKNKIRRRIKSLVIPYLIWNAITLMLFLFSQLLMPSLNSGETKAVVDYTLSDWFRAFWDLSNGYPICSQFWFIRDLILMSIASPLICFLCKKVGGLYLIFLGALWMLDAIHDLPGFSLTGLFFFSLGALLSIKRIDVIKVCRRMMVPALVCLLVLTSLEVIYRQPGGGIIS